MVSGPLDTGSARNIAYIITGVWAVSFLADIIPAIEYEPSPFIHAIMLVVVGAIFGVQITKNGKSEKVRDHDG